MLTRTAFGLVLLMSALAGASASEKIDLILGSVTALKGPSEGLGLSMTAGLEAALKDEVVHGQKVRLVVENDNYHPMRTIAGTNKLIDGGVFAMIGNVGTPTAAASLPILQKHGVPAVGFFTGAGLLRQADDAPVINYRASYVQETAAVIDAALKTGLKPAEVCAFVQNDSYGMAGLAGVRLALQHASAEPDLIKRLENIAALSDDDLRRNGQGPVGVYTRNNEDVSAGYASLKQWEKQSGTNCRLVVTAGSYVNIAKFIQESRRKHESWMVSAVSFTGADNLRAELEKSGDTKGVIMTQVVPLLDSPAPIVREARSKLGDKFGFVSLEGYIVGRMALRILRDIPGEITREAFLNQAKKAKFDLGGLAIDFTKNSKQGSDLVVVSYLTPNGYKAVNSGAWQSMLK